MYQVDTLKKMMKKKQWMAGITALLLVCFMFPGCAAGTEQTNATEQAQTESSLFDPGYSDRDFDSSWDKSEAVSIILQGDTIEVEGTANGDQGSADVEINGSTVTLKNEGTYVLSGTLTNGQVIIEAEKTDKIQLVLNNADLTCANSAPVYIKEADKVFLTIAEGSANKITDGSEYMFAEGEDEPDGAIFSKADLTLNGTGALTVTANYKDGIVSKDDLVVTAENVTVTAIDDGLRGKDSVAISCGALSIQAGADGIKSTNSTDESKGWISIDGGNIVIIAANDGLQAETNLQVTEGNCSITAGGGSADVVFNTNNRGMAARDFSQMPPDNQTPSDHMGVDSMNPDNMNADQRVPGDRKGPMNGNPMGNVSQSGVQMRPENRGDQMFSGNMNKGASQANTSATTTEESISTKGIKASVNLVLAGGTIVVDSADDAIHSNGNVTVLKGTFNLSSGDDGIHADNELLIEEGKITITKSYEALEGATVTINGGEIDVTAADDALNAAGGSDNESLTAAGITQDSFAAKDSYFIRITGGTLQIDAGGDGIDSNGDLFITGGKVIVSGPQDSGNGILDYEGKAQISGGTFLGSGSSGMLQLFSEQSTQNTLAITYNTTQEAGTTLTLKDESGKEIASFTPEKIYQTVIISSAQLEDGKTYTLANETKEVTVTLSGLTTSILEDGSVNNSQFGQRGSGRGHGNNPL